MHIVERRAGDVDELARRAAAGLAAAGGVRGFTPVKWCVERLTPGVRVMDAVEMAWRLRWRHDPEETRRAIDGFQP